MEQIVRFERCDEIFMCIYSEVLLNRRIRNEYIKYRIE